MRDYAYVTSTARAGGGRTLVGRCGGDVGGVGGHNVIVSLAFPSGLSVHMYMLHAHVIVVVRCLWSLHTLYVLRQHPLFS